MIKIKYSIISGLAFAIISFIYLAITSKIDVAIVISIFTFLISSFLFYFKMFSRIDTTSQFNKIDKKLVLYSGRANHYNDGITVGGTLYLLNDRVIFQTNLINFLKKHEKVIFLNEISKVDFVNNMKIINNELIIENNHNMVNKFVVTNKQIWTLKIEKLLF